jgi:hypothetical protein
MTTLMQPVPPPPKMRSKPVRPPVTPSIKPPVTPRGGTPISVKDAPGYRGSGTPPMPSSKARGFSKGGSASKRADGCAQRGKTRGKMV